MTCCKHCAQYVCRKTDSVFQDGVVLSDDKELGGTVFQGKHRNVFIYTSATTMVQSSVVHGPPLDCISVY